MKYSIICMNFYTGIEVPVVVRTVNKIEENIDNRFRLIFIKKGSGLIETPMGFTPFVAPTLCCINETEGIKIQASQIFETTELIYLRLHCNELSY